MKTKLVLLAAASLVACPDAQRPPPGTEVMGTFEFLAVPSVPWTCNLSEAPRADSGFTFQATFSRNPDSAEVWMTLGGISRPAKFDGQFVESEFAAPRVFEACAEAVDGGACEEEPLFAERLRVALLSRSQNDFYGGCPANPLEGGVHADGGVTLPQSTERGFDAIRACGELRDELVPPVGCGCTACAMVYSVTGVRR